MPNASPARHARADRPKPPMRTFFMTKLWAVAEDYDKFPRCVSAAPWLLGHNRSMSEDTYLAAIVVY